MVINMFLTLDFRLKGDVQLFMDWVCLKDKQLDFSEEPCIKIQYFSVSGISARTCRCYFTMLLI